MSTATKAARKKKQLKKKKNVPKGTPGESQGGPKGEVFSQEWEETIKDPAVADLIKKYKEIAFRWNSVTSFLQGKSKINPETDLQQYSDWLAKSYYHDIHFLLNQLQVLKPPSEEQVKDAMESTNQQEETNEERQDG